MSEYEFNHRQIWPELYDPDFPGDYQVVRLYPLENTVRTLTPLPFQFDDGGRAKAAFQSLARDCVTRSIAIATGLPYQRVYQDIASGNAAQKATSKTPKRSLSADHGVNTRRKWFKEYMSSLGFEWVPAMHVGNPKRAYLCEEDLPTGRLVVALSKHYTAVINGVIRDTFNCCPDGSRCVFGFWRLKG